MAHIAYLGSLHKLTKPLLAMHKRLTKEMLAWPSPFQMTQSRKEQIYKQQRVQATPDTIIEILIQIQEELQHFYVFLQQTMPHEHFRADGVRDNKQN